MPTFKEKARKWMLEFAHDLSVKLEVVLMFLFSGALFWLLLQFIYFIYGFSIVSWLLDIPIVAFLFEHFVFHIQEQTELGIFYLFLFFSLFFLPIPLELIFINYLRQGIPQGTLFVLAVGGIFFGQLLNYLLGRFFGFFLKYFVKRKHRKKIHRRLKLYGMPLGIVLHIIPFPYQMFNFVAGVLRYPFAKVILYVLIGLCIKHFLIIAFFDLFL